MTTTSAPHENSETAKWISYLPQAFGIQEAVRQSPFRWCARESLLWGIATGTTMTLHRLRMKSNPMFAVNVGFATLFLVSMPSYYFCYRRRENKERMIELMMKANDFSSAEEMPEEPKIGQDHPFLEERGNLETKEYVAHLPERKEWQTQVPQQDAKDVFQEKKKR